MTPRKSPVIIAAALAFTVMVPAIGYISFGSIPALLFFIGYISGFALWLMFPDRAAYGRIKILYWVTFALFLVHRVEEKVSDFFQTLADITGIPTPEIVSIPIIGLLIVSVLAWIAGPFLMKGGHAFGYYLVWTFFASMGITELAHFVIPLVIKWPKWYFPGMLSVLVLAPVAWIGIWRLSQKNQ